MIRSRASPRSAEERRAGRNRHPRAPPHIRDADGRSRLLVCVRDAARERDKATLHAALHLLWTSQHIDAVRSLEAHLQRAQRAT